MDCTVAVAVMHPVSFAEVQQALFILAPPVGIGSQPLALDFCQLACWNIGDSHLFV